MRPANRTQDRASCPSSCPCCHRPENERGRPWDSCAAAVQFFQVPLPHPKLGHCRSTAQGKCRTAPGCPKQIPQILAEFPRKTSKNQFRNLLDVFVSCILFWDAIPTFGPEKLTDPAHYHQRGGGKQHRKPRQPPNCAPRTPSYYPRH